MVKEQLPWPTKDEYDLAIDRWRQTVHDPDLQRGELKRVLDKPAAFGGAALYVRVYRIGDWMVRCFCSSINPRQDPPTDIRMRYREIARFTQEHKTDVPALIEISYLEHGVTIGNHTVPVVKMPFLTNMLPLGSFIEEHRGESATMRYLAESWRGMVREMEATRVAHGDLDLTNVMAPQYVTGTGLALKLIDYDNMWIPTLGGRDQTEHGHDNFQHPAFLAPNPRPYDVDMDRYSSLVIYLSLRALAINPGLYMECRADESEQLLFSQADYREPSLETSRIMVVRKRCGAEVAPYVDELLDCLAQRRMPRALDAIAAAPSVPLFTPTPQSSTPLSPISGSPISGTPFTPTPMMGRPANPTVPRAAIMKTDNRVYMNQAPGSKAPAQTQGPAPRPSVPGAPVAPAPMQRPGMPIQQPQQPQQQQPMWMNPSLQPQPPAKSGGNNSAAILIVVGIVVAIILLVLIFSAAR